MRKYKYKTRAEAEEKVAELEQKLQAATLVNRAILGDAVEWLPEDPQYKIGFAYPDHSSGGVAVVIKLFKTSPNHVDCWFIDDLYRERGPSWSLPLESGYENCYKLRELVGSLYALRNLREKSAEDVTGTICS